MSVQPHPLSDPDPDATVLRPHPHGVPASRLGPSTAATVASGAAFDPDATVILVPQRALQAGMAAMAPPGVDPDATVLRGPMPERTGLPAAPEQALALPPGFRLHEYRIDGVLGQGGFGITYLATDVHLDAKVAIKEYLPEEIAFRAGDRSVSPNASRHRDRYREGLESFLVEARTLASFRHPAIVRVARFFEAHRTAYMVLEYEQGQSFKTWWPAQAAALGERAEARLIELLLPLLDGLATVHAAGVLHRDIKPDNIQVRQADGSLALLDFGSAGQAVAEQGAVVVTPGYAPIEQYGFGAQGPWTDLYALAATLYWAVAGRKPADAEARAMNPDAMPSAQAVGQGRYGTAFLAAIDAALDTDATARPRSVAEFRRLLCADHVASMKLQDALQRHDTVIEGDFDSKFEGPGSRKAPGMLQRLCRGLRGGRWRRLRDWPLAVKMTLAMLATALLPMALVGSYNLSGSVDAVAGAELQNVEQMAHSTAGRLGQFVTGARHTATAYAGDEDLVRYLQQPGEGARTLLTARLVRLAGADPDVQLLMVLDLQGQGLLSNDPRMVGRSFGFRDYFQQAAAGRPHSTGLTVGSVDGAAGLFFSEPVRDASGAVVGVLVLRVLGQAVERIMKEVQHDSSLTPLLVDGDGVVVHHPRRELLYSSLAPLNAAALARIRDDRRFQRDTIPSLGETALAQAMLGARATGHVSWRSALSGVDEIAGYAPVPGVDWVVGVLETRANFEAPVRRLYVHMLISGALIGLLFAGLALRFARSIVRPVQALTDAAAALKAGDHDAARVQAHSRDEVGQLARTFNVLIDVLRQRERESRHGRKGE